MKFFLSCILCFTMGFQAYSQDAMAKDSTQKPVKKRIEIGLNITNTLSSVIGSSNTGLTTDPYLLSLRVGSAERRVRIGLNFKVLGKEDLSDTRAITVINERRFDLRVGHEWVRQVAPKMGFYWGFDGIVSAQMDNVKVSDFFGGESSLRNRVWGLGLGPVLGLQFKLHPRVILTTESSIYAVYKIGYKEVNAIPDIRKNRVQELNWQPLIPTTLFINFVF